MPKVSESTGLLQSHEFKWPQMEHHGVDQSPLPLLQQERATVQTAAKIRYNRPCPLSVEPVLGEK